MDISLKKYRDPSGILFPVIVRDRFIPVCLYLNNHVHSSFGGLAANTYESYARQLMFVYKYFTGRKIDLVERVATGEFFTTIEIDAFHRHCKHKVEGDKGITNVVQLTDKRLSNAIHATQHSESKSSSFTFKMRLYRFLGYIRYLYLNIHADNSPPISVSTKFSDFQMLVEDHIARIRADNTDTEDPFEKAIPDDKFFKILEIIKPTHAENPWKGSKLRNQVITGIHIEAGLRAGAILKMKFCDVKDEWDNPRFMVTRTPNDQTDKRLRQAANKTKTLSASVSPELMKLLKLYINTERCKHPNSASHDFIFVSEKGETAGQALTYGSLHSMICILGEAIGFHIHPHLLRHKWNEIFTDRAEQAGYSHDEIDDIRKYAMGWSENSSMTGLYNKFKIAVKISELSSARQNETVPPQGE